MQSPRDALKTSMQGYLLKNHDGGKFAVKNNQRYFTSAGFTVFYYETEKKSKAKGHFDLRNVLSIRPSADKGAPAGAIDLEVGAPNGGVAKRMVIAFLAGEDDRSQWLKLWCSAVVPAGVSAVLASYANPQLAAKLNSEYGGTSAVSARRSIFSSNKPKATIVLTPRTAEALRQQNGDDDPRGAPTVPPHDTSGYDTPRDQSFAPGGPPLPKPEGTPPQPSQTKEDEEDVVTFEITVPDNVQPGDKLQATTPSGVRVKLSVPEGAEPGTILTFALPGAVGGADRKAKAAVLLQARARGAKTRAELAAGPPAGSTASAKTPEDEEIELGLAAIKLQKNFRGHSARTEQQEKSRLEWLAYYMQPEVALWEKARELAISAEEEAQIEAVQKGVEYEETSRLKWFRFYVSTSEFDEADKLVVTPIEAALVLRSRATVPPRCCACIQLSAPAAEAERYERFVQAIRSYHWEVAEVLALTPVEAQDVADSKVRVAALQHAISTNDTTKALEYAITNEEIAYIRAKASAK